MLRSLRTPVAIQRYLDEQVLYDPAERCRSPRMLMRDGKGHCMEGALFGAAALRYHGFPPLLMDLVAVRDDDHVLAVYKVDGCWGAVAKSNYASLRSREPVYRSLRELAMSYFEHYHNLQGEKSLRGYTRPVRLDRFDGQYWMTALEDVWMIPEYLCTVSHTRVITARQEAGLNLLDPRLRKAEMTGMRR